MLKINNAITIDDLDYQLIKVYDDAVDVKINSKDALRCVENIFFSIENAEIIENTSESVVTYTLNSVKRTVLLNSTLTLTTDKVIESVE